MRVLQVIAALILAGTAVSAQSQLSVAGKPYLGGSNTLSLVAPNDIGKPVFLAVGLNPLPLEQPLVSSKGPFFIGTLLNVLSLGAIPSGGALAIPFNLPANAPGLQGLRIVVQGYIPHSLSNAAIIPFDLPDFLPTNSITVENPNPTTKALFGYRIAAADYNGDGALDLAVSAAYENYLGVSQSGRVYVMWGPDYSSNTTLSPSSPHVNGFYGISVTAADLDGDGLSDLIVGETTGDPPPAGVTGKLNVYFGAFSFSSVPGLIIPSNGTGPVFTGFGHAVVVGDFNGDLHRDIAVSVNGAAVQGVTKAGRIDIRFGPGWTSGTSIVNPDPEMAQAFGSALASADINGDGIDDIVESSNGDDVGSEPNQGSMHVFLGPSLTLYKSVFCPSPLPPTTDFGIYMSAADVNGDGFADVMVADDKNRVFLFFGPTLQNYALVPKPPSDFHNPFGETDYGSTLRAGDFNDDGIGDLVIADGFEGSLNGCPVAAEGTVFIATGPYFSTFQRLNDSAPSCANYFGSSISGVDLNSDGALDCIVGVDAADDFGLVNCGHVTIMLH